jgi:catechol 2,3-dioxygenase-like lactoylglutathione lyase family enzyme
MSIRRVVPDIKSQHLAESRAFYVDFLGLEVAMDMGFVMTFVSPSNPTAQISVVRDDGGSKLLPDVSVEVEDVDQLHKRAIERGLEIVYPLTDEPWGVRRFFVVDPNGTILNVMSHLPGSK